MIDETQLTAYAFGELDGAALDAVEARLARDAAAREEVLAIQRTAALLEDALAAEAPPERLGRSQGPRAPRRRAVILVVAAAAVMLLAILAGLGLAAQPDRTARRHKLWLPDPRAPIASPDAPAMAHAKD